jgi:hypothetical protein
MRPTPAQVVQTVRLQLGVMRQQMAALQVLQVLQLARPRSLLLH